MTARQTLLAGLEALGLGLDPLRQDLLLAYLDLLDKWNRVYNLTAVRAPELMVSHHLLDSLSVASHLPQQRLLDVGTGAGLPGLPLAIARPELEVDLLESNQKRIAFLRQAVATLGLKNVRILEGRVEDTRLQPLFAAIISRAYAELAEFVASTDHLLAPGGCFFAMKGLLPEAEIKRLPRRYRVRALIRLNVPMLDAERHLVVVERVE